MQCAIVATEFASSKIGENRCRAGKAIATAPGLSRSAVDNDAIPAPVPVAGQGRWTSSPIARAI
jgi:hypothetical protein